MPPSTLSALFEGMQSRASTSPPKAEALVNSSPPNESAETSGELGHHHYGNNDYGVAIDITDTDLESKKTPHFNQTLPAPTNGYSSRKANTMSGARDIVNGMTHAMSNTLTISTSPTSTFRSPASSYPGSVRTGGIPVSARQLKPFNTEDIKILLLENVNETARDILVKQGYQVEFHKSSLPEAELIEKIRYCIPLRPFPRLCYR